LQASWIYLYDKRNKINRIYRIHDAYKLALKKVKQQILAFCLRYDFRFTSGKSYWTQKHLAWLRSLEMDVLMREILDEYLQTYQNMADKIERFDKRIEELAGGTTVLTRFLSFVLFPLPERTPAFVRYLGRVLPAAVFGFLVVYCLRGEILPQAVMGFPKLWLLRPAFRRTAIR
jgi:hypothetical protein